MQNRCHAIRLQKIDSIHALDITPCNEPENVHDLDHEIPPHDVDPRLVVPENKIAVLMPHPRHEYDFIGDPDQTQLLAHDIDHGIPALLDSATVHDHAHLLACTQVEP